MPALAFSAACSMRAMRSAGGRAPSISQPLMNHMGVPPTPAARPAAMSAWMAAFVAVHHEQRAGCLGRLDHAAGIVEGRRQRFLADHRDAARGGERDEVGVAFRRRDDVDEVRLHGIKHLLRVGEDLGRAFEEFLREHRGDGDAEDPEAP